MPAPVCVAGGRDWLSSSLLQAKHKIKTTNKKSLFIMKLIYSNSSYLLSKIRIKTTFSYFYYFSGIWILHIKPKSAGNNIFFQVKFCNDKFSCIILICF